MNYILSDPLSSSECSCDFNNCFSCVGYQNEASPNCECHWDLNQGCLSSQSSTHKSKDNLKNLLSQQCKDSSSISLREAYCGKSLLDLEANTETEISIINKENIYGFPNLFCEYVYSIEEEESSEVNKESFSYSLSYKISPNATEYLKTYLEYYNYEEENPTSHNIEITQQNYYIQLSKIKKIKISIIVKKAFSETPFSLTILKTKNKSSKSLFMDIGIILVVAVICGGAVYFITVRIAKKERQRQREEMRLRRATTTSTNAQTEYDNIEIKTKKIIDLFKTNLVPIIYKNHFNINNCDS